MQSTRSRHVTWILLTSDILPTVDLSSRCLMLHRRMFTPWHSTLPRYNYNIVTTYWDNSPFRYSINISVAWFQFTRASEQQYSNENILHQIMKALEVFIQGTYQSNTYSTTPSTSLNLASRSIWLSKLS